MMTHNKSTATASSQFQNSTHDYKDVIPGDLFCLAMTRVDNNLKCTQIALFSERVKIFFELPPTVHNVSKIDSS